MPWIPALDCSLTGEAAPLRTWPLSKLSLAHAPSPSPTPQSTVSRDPEPEAQQENRPKSRGLLHSLSASCEQRQNLRRGVLIPTSEHRGAPRCRQNWGERSTVPLFQTKVCTPKKAAGGEPGGAGQSPQGLLGRGRLGLTQQAPESVFPSFVAESCRGGTAVQGGWTLLSGVSMNERVCEELNYNLCGLQGQRTK